MADYTTPSTELDAVNAMLSAIGESPVNSVDDSTPLPPDADNALRVLRIVLREVQAVGWQFNTEPNWTLTPAVDGTITLPANTLRSAITKYDPTQDITTRGLKVYDRYNHTYQFTKPLLGELVLLLTWDDLPEAARAYIYLRAARRFQSAVMGSTELHGFTEEDEAAARALLLEAEGDVADYNILTNNMDSLYIVSRDFGIVDPVRDLGSL